MHKPSKGLRLWCAFACVITIPLAPVLVVVGGLKYAVPRFCEKWYNSALVAFKGEY